MDSQNTDLCDQPNCGRRWEWAISGIDEKNNNVQWFVRVCDVHLPIYTGQRFYRLSKRTIDQMSGRDESTE